MISLDNKTFFSQKKRPLIIAEISGNHNGSKKRFLNLIKAAYKNGADIVKIQTYEPKDITLKNKSKKFRINNGIWKNQYLWDLYKKACTPFAWHDDAFKIAKTHKKIIFSSPFSIRAVDLLEKYKVKLYKIASFELSDHRLIEYVASKKKPIIISTGVSDYREIKDAIKIINKYHNKIVILHCVSNYPTQLKDTNLANIKFLKKKFKNNFIGLSDHTNDIHSSIASLPLGIVAIEKHFNLDNAQTPDSKFSIDPKKLKKLSVMSKELFESINSNKKLKVKNKNSYLKRSIFSSKKINKNEILTKQNTITLRPLIGIPAKNYFKILGKRINKSIDKNMPIFQKDLLNK